MTRTKKEPPLTGRARKDQLMVRAREIAAKGGCISFTAVLVQFEPDEQTNLKLYASASDRDEIDRICDRSRIKSPSSWRGKRR